MALSCGFYNGPNRMYDAEQLSSIFDGIISDGMYSGFKQAMVVIESQNDNEVIIQPGRAWLLHTWAYNDANLPFEAPQSEVVLDRIDALVLDVDSNPEVKNTTFQWVQGTPASQNPERPTLIDTENHKQYPLCYVYRAAGTDTITQANITNTVGTSELPFVTGIIDTIDTNELLIQWEAQWEDFMANYVSDFSTWSTAQKASFETWFESIRGILDEDAAGHLQNEIDALQNNVNTLQNEVDGVEELILPVGEKDTPANTWTAMQVKNGDNVARLQMNAEGALRLFQSTDNGETWSQKEVGEKPNIRYNEADDWIYIFREPLNQWVKWQKALLQQFIYFNESFGYNADVLGQIRSSYDGIYSWPVASVTINSTYINYHLQCGAAQQSGNGYFVTTNKVSVTQYTKLVLKGSMTLGRGSGSTQASGNVTYSVQLVNGSNVINVGNGDSRNSAGTTNQDKMFDISQWSGEYQIRIKLTIQQTSADKTLAEELNITELYLM